VKSPFLEDYRTLRTDRRGNLVEKLPPEATDLAQKLVNMYGSLPIGTLIPVRIAGQDYLAVFQWHHNHIPSGALGVEFWVPKAGRHGARILSASRSQSRLFAGIDCAVFPGKEIMKRLWEQSNVSWTGFYLPAPRYWPGGNTSSTWTSRVRGFLADLGWGIAPIYVGEQQADGRGHVFENGKDKHNPMLTAGKGRADGLDAALKAWLRGFPANTVIYLDIEGGSKLVQPRMADYYRAWCEAVVSLGHYPGIYCSPNLAPDLMMKTDLYPEVWVARFPRAGQGLPILGNNTWFPTPDPIDSRFPGATAWQWIGDATLRDGRGHVLIQRLDLDSANRKDPGRRGYPFN
jgi:hypothetical protein